MKWAQRLDEWWRRDGRLARVVAGLFVVLMGLNAVTGAVNAGAAVTATLSAAGYLGWEIVQRRIGRWGGLLGAAMVGSGCAAGADFPVWLGLAIIVLSLGIRAGVAVAVLALLIASAWWRDLPDTDLPMRYLGLVMSALLVCLFQMIARAARSLREASEELAAVEVDADRNRLASRLNAMIGQTLEAVADEVAIARESATIEDPRVHAQLDDIEALLQRGLDQLGALSFEPVVGKLDDEVDTTHTLCRRLGVDFIPSVDEVDPAAHPIFALLLRESVTNMFKHAQPTRCSLVTRQLEEGLVFSFTNDGAPERHATDGGSGQRRWRATVEELGGTLDVRALAGRRYRVLVRLPAGTIARGARTAQRKGAADD